MDIRINPQDRFMADLQRATSGITYTPQQIQGLSQIAQSQGASQGSLNLIANAPQRQVTGNAGGNIVDAVGNTGGIQRQRFEYPTELPAIPPDLLAAFNAQRRIGTAGVEQAELFRQRGATEATGRAGTQTSEIGRQVGRDVAQSMSNFAAGGRARAPLGVNQARAEIAAGGERQQIVVQEQLAQAITELDRMVSDAQFAKQRGDADIDMQMAMQRSNAALENLRRREAIDMANWQAGLR